MTDHVHKYRGEKIDVTYDAKRCIHAAECLRGLPEVFDTERRPWVTPDSSEARMVAEIVMRCPSGALHYDGKDDILPESPSGQNSITISPNGPLYVNGDVELLDSTGKVILQDTRLALCRCGASENKPFCDNSHRRVAFKHFAGSLVDPGDDEDSESLGDKLIVQASQNGPYLVQGKVEIRASRGSETLIKSNAALCRCGGSNNKPFCDGTHEKNGFSSS